MKKDTARAPLTSAGDCDPHWLTTHVPNLNTAAPPDILTVKKLTFRRVFELRYLIPVTVSDTKSCGP